MENINELVPVDMELGEFFMELHPDGAIIKRVQDGLKVLHFHDDVLTFHSPEGFVLYEMNEHNQNQNDEDRVNFLLDVAWDNVGFGARVELAASEFVTLLADMENDDA